MKIKQRLAHYLLAAVALGCVGAATAQTQLSLTSQEHNVLADTVDHRGSGRLTGAAAYSEAPIAYRGSGRMTQDTPEKMAHRGSGRVDDDSSGDSASTRYRAEIG